MVHYFCSRCQKRFQETEVTFVEGQAVCKACSNISERPPEAKPAFKSTSQGPVAKTTKEKPRPQVGQKDFLKQIRSIFSYPFRGGGTVTFIIGAIFFWILQFVAVFSIFGFLVAIFIGGYLAAYIIKIINSSAVGEAKLPEWPDFTNFWDSIINTYLLVVATNVVAFAPALIYFVIMFWQGMQSFIPFYLLLLLGLLYIPMGLLAVALCNSVKALNPRLVIPSIFRVFREYFIVCVALVLLLGLRTLIVTFLVSPIPIIGSIVDVFVSLYFLILEARIIGLMYLCTEDKLGWFSDI